MRVTAQAYREAASIQVEAARNMLEDRQYTLANYLAGLSVECMLRAYSSHLDNSFDARHDLRRWYEKSSLEAIVPTGQRERISIALSTVAAQWNNSQRYYSAELYRAEIKQAQLDRGIKGDALKEVTRRTVDAALEVVVIGEAQWNNFLRRSKRF